MLTNRLRAAGPAVLIAFLAAAVPLEAHTIPLDAEGMVRGSKQIVVAVVTAKTVRWNESHRLIVTDYELAVEDWLKGSSPRVITLRMPGGTLDGETHVSCLTVPLEVGARYLLFLKDLSAGVLSPIAGAAQGALREVTRNDGPPMVRPSSRTEPLSDSAGNRISFGDFVARTKTLIEDVESRPDLRPRPAAGVPQDLPRKKSDPGGAALHLPAFAGVPALRPSFADSVGAPPEPEHPRVDPEPAGTGHAGPASPVPTPAPSTAGGISPLYVYQYPANRYIVFNQLPSYMTPWAPRDQYMMSEWNRYADIFRVYQSPTSTWSWGDGVFDIAGFPSDQDMLDQFGQSWGDIGDHSGITFWRYVNNAIVEADVCLNPHFSWTTDNEYGSRVSNTVFSFDPIMLHELGHSWGLHHPWESQDVWWDSVMNYMPKQFRFPILATDDVNALRRVYPGIAMHDGFLASYSTADDPSSTSAAYSTAYPSPFSVAPGGSFSLANYFKLENNGTDSIVNPSIEVYLTPARMSWANALYLRTASYTVTLPTFFTQYLTLSSTTLPASVPPGMYYVGLYYRDAYDANSGNNSAWTQENVQLSVYQPTPVTIVPTTSWQTTNGSGAIGPEGTFTFVFAANPESTYDLSFCSADGGSGSFDTVLELHNTAWTIVAANDDSCGLQSKISGFMPPAAGNYWLVARGYAASSYGNFRLAYRRNAACQALTVGPSSLPDATYGAAYSQTLGVSGGYGPYTYAVTAGALPSGLSLGANGVLSGTPTLTGSFAFTVTATDAYGCTGVTQYTMNVVCPKTRVGGCKAK